MLTWPRAVDGELMVSSTDTRSTQSKVSLLGRASRMRAARSRMMPAMFSRFCRRDDGANHLALLVVLRRIHGDEVGQPEFERLIEQRDAANRHVGGIACCEVFTCMMSRYLVTDQNAPY